MKVTLTYTLPDELTIYKAALKAKYDSNSNTLCPVELSALQELHKAITMYMLQPNHDNLSNLNKIMDKYEKYT